ncbi:MAG: phage virion morphogenesis protein [Candidatus Kapabacteria bacterium]|nr:phage virion morphogenesis protein [Candidatus Kapabacteria bacterium]
MTIEQFSQTFIRIVTTIDDPGVMGEIGQLMERSIQKNFDGEGRYGEVIDGEYDGGGNKWKPFGAVTIARRKKKGYYPGKILQQTGATKGSVIATASKGGILTLASQTVYSSYLHYGTKRMAARPFLVVQEEDREQILNVYAEFIQERLR